MKRRTKVVIVLLALISTSYGCSDTVEKNSSQDSISEELRIGFELVQILSSDSIMVWANQEPLTQEQFDSIEISNSWAKNEPREGMPNFARFLRSPDANQNGVFTTGEHFGYQWLFNAQIVENDVPLQDDEQGLLTARYIGKFHEVTFDAGRILSILISPSGDEFILISRDVNRLTDIPLIPESWRIEERQISEELTIELPNPTLNIRTENNQDSWQGPVYIQ